MIVTLRMGVTIWIHPLPPLRLLHLLHPLHRWASRSGYSFAQRLTLWRASVIGNL